MEPRTRTCRVIAVVNQKGGVGKTVTATNLGVGLARHGPKVLIVDCDCQASQTVSLGWKNPDELPVTLATQLEKIMANKPFDPQDGILHHDEGIELMPSSIELSGLEMRMVNAMSRERLLRTYLDAQKSQYDFIVLDCPPTLGMMTINALAATDSVVIPIAPEYLSVVGMQQLFDTLGMVKQHLNPDLRIEGALVTLANMRTNLAKNTVGAVQKAYGDDMRVFPTPIPYSVRIKEASTAGQSIYAYEKGGQAAYAYEQLVKEVLRDGRSLGGSEHRNPAETTPR